MKLLENKVYRKIKNAGMEIANKQVLSSSDKCNKSKENSFYAIPRTEGVFDSDSYSESEVRERERYIVHN